MSFLKKIANYRKSDSLAFKFRMKRMMFFRALIAPLPKPISVLDVGGEKDFWNRMGFDKDQDLRLTIINMSQDHLDKQNPGHVYGDARDLSRFSDKEFDVVFSNSVIEHVGTFGDQMQMAQEVHRVGKRYFVQTPNYFFPIEPHFLFPGFQFLPLRVKMRLVLRRSLGFMPKAEDKESAKQIALSARLLTFWDLKKLFPEAEIKREIAFGLTKSFMCYQGF